LLIKKNPNRKQGTLTSSTGLSGPEEVCPRSVVMNKLWLQELRSAEFWECGSQAATTGGRLGRERSIWAHQQK